MDTKRVPDKSSGHRLGDRAHTFLAQEALGPLGPKVSPPQATGPGVREAPGLRVAPTWGAGRGQPAGGPRAGTSESLLSGEWGAVGRLKSRGHPPHI